MDAGSFDVVIPPEIHRKVVRPVARSLALTARAILTSAERMLRDCGDPAAAAARDAATAVTALIRDTHDGPSTTFACER